MKKLTLLILFVCALALCLVACGPMPANTTTTTPCVHKDENNNHKCDVCDTIVSYSENLAYTLSEDGTYYILSGIGTCADTDIVIPHIYNGLPIVHIGHSAFEECTHLTSVEIPDSVTSIEDFAFSGCRSMTSVTIPDSVTSIGIGAFVACNNLLSITLPDGITSIEEYTFAGCFKVVSIVIPDSVTNIEDWAFQYCDSLASVEFGDSVTRIGSFAFSNCISLTSVIIPDSVTEVECEAFSDCTSLASVEIGADVTSIGYGAFYNCTNLASFKVSADNASYQSIDGNLYSKDGECLVQYAIGKTATHFEIPRGVMFIEYGAFYECTVLTSITIPDSVISVKYDAFAGCDSLIDVYYTGTEEEWLQVSIDSGNGKLASVAVLCNYGSIPYSEGLEYILSEDGTYYTLWDKGTCTDTDVVILPVYKGLPVKSVGGFSFYNYKNLTSVTIPRSVTSIEYGAFYECTVLTSITIPDSVTSVEYDAFAGCDSLIDVYYTGTEEEWSQISIGSNNYDLTSATIHYNYVPEN